MLTLEEARKIQKIKISKTLTKSILFSALILTASFCLFKYTDILTWSSLYYLIPFAGLFVVFKITHTSELFLRKEFIGEVVNIDIYSADERKIKRGGLHPLQDRYLEAEIMVKNEAGKTTFKIFRNGDTTSRLSVGDNIAVLSFIDEPVVIKGNARRVEP